MADWGLGVTWEPSDLSKFMPPSAPEQARMTAPLSSSKATAGPTHTKLASSDDSEALSTGAEAGIGVGAAVIVLIIVALIVWLCLRGRKQRQRRQLYNRPDGFNSNVPLNRGYPPQALHEADARQPLNEADVRKASSPPHRAELYGAWEGHELDQQQRYEAERRPYA